MKNETLDQDVTSSICGHGGSGVFEILPVDEGSCRKESAISPGGWSDVDVR